MRFVHVCLIAGFCWTSLACTKAATEFETLDQSSIPQPTFNGNTSRSFTTSNPAQTFSVSGECDTKIAGITASVIGGVSNVELSSIATAVSVSCQTSGVFSFTLNSLTALGFTPSVGQTYIVELVADTPSGPSNPSQIRITYSSSLTSPVLLSSGATPNASDGSRFSATLRVTGKHDPGVKTDGSRFTATVGVQTKFD
jgi:hypothetical protein